MPRSGEIASAGHTVIDRKPAVSAEQRMHPFHARLKERGLKSTGQRDDIARVFFDYGHHLGAEELYAEVKMIDPHVGYATIYRTLRLFKECGLLYERHFDEGQARYEAVGERHHDHFICERCGRIIEFENAAIERMQNIVARDLGVTLTRHKMRVSGICSDCHHAQQGLIADSLRVMKHAGPDALDLQAEPILEEIRRFDGSRRKTAVRSIAAQSGFAFP